MRQDNASWAKFLLGYVLITMSTALWLLAPLPWWLPGLDIPLRALSGTLLIALAELSFYLGLWSLGPEEAQYFYRWKRLKRGFRALLG